jgi:hypothetical protein
MPLSSYPSDLSLRLAPASPSARAMSLISRRQTVVILASSPLHKVAMDCRDFMVSQHVIWSRTCCARW